MNQLCMTYLFTKQEPSLISSALKKSYFLKSMLLPNFAFDVIYTGNKKNGNKNNIWWCLNRYYSMPCYYKSSFQRVHNLWYLASLNFFHLQHSNAVIQWGKKNTKMLSYRHSKGKSKEKIGNFPNLTWIAAKEYIIFLPLDHCYICHGKVPIVVEGC